MRVISIGALIFLPFVIVACASESVYEPDILFTSGLELNSTAGVVASAEVKNIGGSLSVDGTMLTPDKCYELTPALTLVGNLITLEMHARNPGIHCAESGIGVHTYFLSTTRYRPSEYRVRVVHSINGIPGEPVAETSVTLR